MNAVLVVASQVTKLQGPSLSIIFVRISLALSIVQFLFLSHCSLCMSHRHLEMLSRVRAVALVDQSHHDRAPHKPQWSTWQLSCVKFSVTMVLGLNLHRVCAEQPQDLESDACPLGLLGLHIETSFLANELVK